MSRNEKTSQPGGHPSKQKSVNKYGSSSKKSPGKYLHEKISVEFFNRLVQHPLFEKYKNAIKPSYDILNWILREQKKNNNRPVTYYSINIKNKFRPYISNTTITNIHYVGDNVDIPSYKSFLYALVELGLLIINHNYQETLKNPITGKIIIKGRCKQYFVTLEGEELITSSYQEYFHKLKSDKTIKRKSQRRASRNKLRHPDYNDPVKNYLKDLLMNIKVDQVDVENTKARYYIEDLINLKEKRIKPLKNNKTDNRIWNPIVALPTEVRRQLKYKNLKYVATIDMRACHFTFLGLLLWEIYFRQNKDYYNAALKEDIKKQNKRYKTIQMEMLKQYSIKNSTITNIHYEGDNSDILESDHIFSGILKEVKKWIYLTTGKRDYRKQLQKRLRITNIKSSLNCWINGAKNSKLDNWFFEEFPIFYSVWKRLDRSEVGSMLSTYYETRLFLDWRLYDFANLLGIKLAYEYDGVGIFAERYDEDKIWMLKNKIRELSDKLFGFTIPLKVDRIEELEEDDEKGTIEELQFYQLEKSGRIRRFKQQLEELWVGTELLRKRAFANNNNKLKRDYFNKQKELDNFLIENEKLINILGN